MSGFVSIVGAGPGGAELLTRKAEAVLRQGDIVIYDRLIDAEILDLVPVGTPRFYAGKSCKEHAMPQAEINRLLVDFARQGKHVVRLKGGDPFIFGRGGEEAEALVAAGVRFEIVPGVSAASACSAYAGIPLTHREHAQGVRYITGHLQKAELEGMDWRGLADPATTLVVYMGLANAGRIAAELQAHGAAAELPAAAVENGGTARQRVVITTLAALCGELAAQGFVSPTLLIIGKVAALGRKLSWFAPEAALPAAYGKRG